MIFWSLLVYVVFSFDAPARKKCQSYLPAKWWFNISSIAWNQVYTSLSFISISSCHAKGIWLLYVTNLLAMEILLFSLLGNKHYHRSVNWIRSCTIVTYLFIFPVCSSLRIDGYAGKAMRGWWPHPKAWHEASCDFPVSDSPVLCRVGSNSCWEQPSVQWPCSRKIVVEQASIQSTTNFKSSFFLYKKPYLSSYACIAAQAFYGSGN